MLKRFDKVKNYTIQSLTELSSSILLKKEELETIHNLLTTLEPIKLNNSHYYYFYYYFSGLVPVPELGQQQSPVPKTRFGKWTGTEYLKSCSSISYTFFE
jgi:hypothetical protein